MNWISNLFNKHYVYIIALSFIAILFLTSCGSSSSSTTDINHKPAISDLYFTPKNISKDDGGGSVTITGTIEFSDNDADVKTCIISSSDDNYIEHPITLTGTLLKSGNIYVKTTVYTTVRRVINFYIWVKDAQGNESNKLYGELIIY
jgi:hypothetical protein